MHCSSLFQYFLSMHYGVENSSVFVDGGFNDQCMVVYSIILVA